MLDRHTEIIAHFIGSFDQDVEQAILRLRYDEFRAQKAKIEEAGALLDVDVKIRSELALDPFDPRVKYSAPYDPSPMPGHVFRVPVEASYSDLQGPSGQTYFRHVKLVAGQTTGQPPSFEPEPFELPPAGSWFALLHQANWNYDNDIFLQRAFDLDDAIMAARAQAALEAEFLTLARAGDGLSLLGLDLTHRDALRDAAEAEAFLEETLVAIEDMRAATGEGTIYAGAGIHVLSAGSHNSTSVTEILTEIGTGSVVMDGVAVEEKPDTLILRLEDRISGERVLDQHQPGYEPPVRDGDEPGAVDEADADTLCAVGETLDVSVHLDAGQLADEGSGIGALIQTIAMGENLLINEFALTHVSVDAGKFIVGGQARDLTIIEQINVLSDRDQIIGDPEAIHGESSSAAHNIVTLDWLETGMRGPMFTGPAEHEGLPASYAVASIAGDFVYSSTTVQINLMSDSDMITFETVFHNLSIETGGNLLSNAAILQGFQNGYDMIVVGGDMVNIAQIQQVNVLFDNDLVAAAPGTLGHLHTSGNLLWNEANLSRTGVDHGVDMSATGRAALDGLAGDGFDPFVFDADDTFTDYYVPSILTVGGNFISQQTLVQINMLTDADTIQIFAGLLDALGFNRIDVSSGDNVLANIANLNFLGQDSAVMAGHGVYSDAVIYQAGMIDHDGGMFDFDFGGGDLGTLASEAVAFLADGLLIDHDNDGHNAGFGGTDMSGGGSGTFDALTSVVT